MVSRLWKRADLLVVGEEAALLQEVAVRVELLGHDVVVHAVAAALVGSQSAFRLDQGA